MEKPGTESISWVRGNCIGQGSFGTVNLALTQSHHRILAAKSVQISTNSHHQIQALELENEIQILSSVSSPWVVEYIGDDVSQESGRSYRNLLMEYLPGGTVADLAPPLSGDEDVVKSYTWCIASALRYIHSKGIVHCDVKGRNILVGTVPGTTKLADFGSAILIRDDEIEKVVRPTRGSPLWMAPEVIRGEYQGPESDLWSLGCTVIEMITGKPAWEDHGCDTLIEIGYSEKVPDFPNGLSEIGRDFLDKCLRRNRAERWTCDQLLQHPFISSSSSPPSKVMTCHHPSPRCVLDWPVMETEYFSEEEESTEMDLELAKRRIGNLASNTSEVNWESDGWTEVRSLVGDCEGINSEEEGEMDDEDSGDDDSESCSQDGGGSPISEIVFEDKKSMQLTIFNIVKLLCVFLVRFKICKPIMIIVRKMIYHPFLLIDTFTIFLPSSSIIDFT